MMLDPATLGLAFVVLTTVLGALLLFSWVVNPKVSALAWWGAGLVRIMIAGKREAAGMATAASPARPAQKRAASGPG